MILVSLCNIVITVTYCLQVPHPPWLQQTHVRQSKGHFECTWSSASVADAEHSKWGGGHTVAFKASLSREVLGACPPGKFWNLDTLRALLVASETNTWHITSCGYVTLLQSAYMAPCTRCGWEFSRMLAPNVQITQTSGHPAQQLSDRDDIHS